MIIKNNIKEILTQWQFEENIFFLPNIQLDRKDYLEINKVLESLGWKWNRSKKGHIFDWKQSELEDALIEVLENGETTTLDEVKKQFQYFPTPSNIAEYVVKLAEIKENDDILEPSAWQWAILDKIIELHSDNKWPLFWDLIACEYNNENANILKEKWYNVFEWDFLNYNPEFKFDKIIANPPFSKSQDIKHILHMYNLLKEGWRIVSIASWNIFNRNGKIYEQLHNLNPEFIWLEEWSFKESGTMVSTCIIIINK